MNTNKIITVMLISVISIALISSVTLSNVDAKKKNKAQIRIVFTDLGNYKGKVKVTLNNNDKHVKLFSETVSLKKDNKETIKFNAKNSQVGDQLTLRVQAPIGSWSFPETFQKSMNEDSANLEEISCANSPSHDCD